MRRALILLVAIAGTGCGTVVGGQGSAASTGGGGGSTSASTTTTSASGSAGPDAYEAVALFTDVSRFAILEASPGRDLCFQVYVALESGGVGIPGLSGAGLTVESALVTNAAADCEVASAPPPAPAGDHYPVVSGMGTVSFSPSPACLAGIHAKLVLSGQPSWAPPSEPLDADGLPILGGCP